MKGFITLLAIIIALLAGCTTSAHAAPPKGAAILLANIDRVHTMDADQLHAFCKRQAARAPEGQVSAGVRDYHITSLSCLFGDHATRINIDVDYDENGRALDLGLSVGGRASGAYVINALSKTLGEPTIRHRKDVAEWVVGDRVYRVNGFQPNDPGFVQYESQVIEDNR